MIEIRNDGKERHQSYEASIKDDDKLDNAIYDLTGYGENKKEAIEDLKKRVNHLINVLSNIDYDKIYHYN